MHMYIGSRVRWSSGLVLAVGFLAMTGCERSKPTKPAPPKEPASVDADTLQKAKVILAKADVLDGEKDMVVHRCPTCALSMDGKAEHALKAMDYTIHFCTERCAQVFSKDLTKSILAMKVPEPDVRVEPVMMDTAELTVDEADREMVLPVLAQADALDGKVDKIVTRCARCALSMDGKPDHTLRVLGYEMYFCRADCAAQFGKDITSSLLSLEVPSGE